MAESNAQDKQRLEAAAGVARDVLVQWASIVGEERHGSESDKANYLISLVSDSMNFIFRVDVQVDGQSKAFALRISGANKGTTSRTQSMVALEMKFLDTLRRASEAGELARSAQVPVPIAADDGRLVVKGGDDSQCVLFEWIEGSRVSHTEACCRDLGSYLAVVHEHGITFEARPGVDCALLPELRDLYAICPPLSVVEDGGSCSGFETDIKVVEQGTAEEGSKTVLRTTTEQATTLREVVEDGHRVLAEMWAAVPQRQTGAGHEVRPGAPRPQVLHADLHFGNVLKTASGTTYLIDFDSISVGFPAQDIAIFCWDLQFDDFSAIVEGRLSDGYAKLRDAFLDGYESVRPLPKGMRGPLLRDLVAHREVVVLAWFAASKFHQIVPAYGRETLKRLRSWIAEKQSWA
jgi:Ser/Thr protein kinase RdoA (MazF antagonist)